MKKKLNLLFVSLILLILNTGCQKEPASYITEDLNPPSVNAGPSRVMQGPVSNFTLTGTASTSNGSIVGQLWSLVSGPNVPVIASPSSPVTSVSSLISGTYIFQYMAIDSVGLTGVDTTSLQILGPVIRTLTLRPANNPTELNFAGYLDGTNISSHEKDIDASAWTNGGNTFYTRGAVKFDLSQIPAGSTIVSAKLSLYSIPDPQNGDQINANSGANNSMYIQRATGNWNSTTSTWLTQPGTTTTDQIVIPHTNQSILDLIDLDVKNIVTTMVNTSNNGFMMKLQNETPYNARQFCSSVHVNTAKHPKLVVVYQ